MYIGIDFGNSYSKVATIYNGNPLLLHEQSVYGIPSEFYYDKEKGSVVGDLALEYGQGNKACNLAHDIKMGILEDKKHVLDGRVFSSKSIVKEIMKNVVEYAKQVAEGHRIKNAEIEGAVITVPAKFGADEIHLIRGAAEECLGKKLPIIAVIREPAAAALTYFKNELQNDDTVLVLDIGGGTSDVALVKPDKNSVEKYVLVDKGMERIGGRDWDKKLEEYLSIRIKVETGIEVDDIPGFSEEIRRQANFIKHKLCQKSLGMKQEKRVINGSFFINGRMVRIPIKTEIFDEISLNLLNKVLDCAEEVYNNNILNYNIKNIICVGGSAHMPQIYKGVKERFKDCNVRVYESFELNKSCEPEHAVVFGAAYFADMMVTKGWKKDENKIDTSRIIEQKSTFSYGVSTIYRGRKIVKTFIPRNSKLPSSGKYLFRPGNRRQSYVLYNIYEYESDREQVFLNDKGVRRIGRLEIKIPKNIDNAYVMECRLKLNSNELLEVEVIGSDKKRYNAKINLDRDD